MSIENKTEKSNPLLDQLVSVFEWNVRTYDAILNDSNTEPLHKVVCHTGRELNATMLLGLKGLTNNKEKGKIN